MNGWERIIRFADHVVNWLIVLCFVPLLLYGIYAMWDSAHIYQQADASVYETYKPSAEEALSFEELRMRNPEVFGWLTVYGTQIDYPLVQGEDNMKYVNTDAEGNFSLSGSIFLDSRNEKNFQDINNIIYGHHMEKKKMFGELPEFADKSFFDEHAYGAVYYEEAWHGIEFFAFLDADAYDEVLYNAKVADPERYQAYVREHAAQYRELPLQEDAHYVLLSTCASDSTNGRHILVGRLTEQPHEDPFNNPKDTEKNEKGKQK